MAAEYTPITRQEMQELVDSFKRAPTSMRAQQERSEIYYDWALRPTKEGPVLAVRLYTSIPANADEARACGEDALRVVIVRSPNTAKAERILFTLPRVHRTQGWRENLRERLRLAWCLITKGPVCPACGARCAPARKKATGELFWSCTRFPTCRGARRGIRGNKDAGRLLDGGCIETAKTLGAQK